MLKTRLEVKLDRCPGVEHDFGTDHGGEGLNGGVLPGHGAHEHADVGPRNGEGRGTVVHETGDGESGRLGKCRPQLDPVQDRGVCPRVFRVADAPPRGHEIQFSRTHDGVISGTVGMLNLAREEPADGRQPGVRMGRHRHACREADVVGTVVVNEAPGADQRPAALWQRPPHRHGAWAAQRHVPGSEDLGAIW